VGWHAVTQRPQPEICARTSHYILISEKQGRTTEIAEQANFGASREAEFFILYQ
jgi:hypothetical protein